MIKVVEFNWPDFEAFARRTVLIDLRGSVLIIGVAAGGLPLAQRIHEMFLQQGSPESAYAELQCRRPSTEIKKKSPARARLLKATFRIFPKRTNDWLRALEHHRLTQRRETDLERQIHVSGTISTESADWLLIVDDAVDSGASLQHVRDYLINQHSVPPEKLRSLVAAVTQESPLTTPDYAWSRAVLVRFPWSLDAR